jgi:signal transduction histidine kinase
LFVHNSARAFCSAFHVTTNCYLSYGSNVVIALSYTAIAAMLGVLAFRHRYYLPRYPVFLAFTVLICILGCVQLLRIVGEIELPKIASLFLRFTLPISFAAAVIWLKGILPIIASALKRGDVVTLERQKELEHALAEAERLASMAESANKAKTDFLAVMSHELRTPLTATVGFAELLADEVLGTLSPQQSDAVRRIQMSGQHLVGMIDQIMDFSGIEAGKIQVRAEVISVSKLVKEVLDLVRPMMTDKRLTLTINVDKFLLMSTDPQKLRQVLINLMTNAVKFTQKGSVLMDVFSRDDEIVFQVCDTGIGIPDRYQEKIFEQFWQVKQGLTRNVGGAGLGLTICRRFVMALGGEIYIKSICEEEIYGNSQESPGSTFTVILPSNMPQSQVNEERYA